MSIPPAPARVFGYVAAEADVCVLLRRGPSKWVLMVRWDLATDEFEIGQWLKARVYEEECDLSPDGCLFAYQALDGKWRNAAEGVYNAISRPPYFTALALWPLGSRNFPGYHWSKAWLPALQNLVGYGPDKPTIGSLPDDLPYGIVPHDPCRAAIARGWDAKVNLRPMVVRKTEFGRLDWHYGELDSPGRFVLDGAPFDVQWADVDHRGRLLLAREGRIYVRDADGERELIDLNPYEFRPLEAPGWAKQWP